MKAIKFDKPGGSDVLYLAEIDIPEPADDQILLKNHAIGINRPDILQRKGLYPPPSNASPILGLESSGEVIKVGRKVSKWKVGDMACALTPGGSYAEFVVCNENHALKIPKNVSTIEAASLPETFFTVWINLVKRVNLKKNDLILIHGGSSGIGITSIQIAKAFGNKIIVTVGNNEKKIACQNLGADLVINYKSEDIVKKIMDFTSNYGVDVILNMVGGEYIQQDINLLANDGRLSFIAFLNGAIREIDFSKVLMKRLTITGSTLRPRSDEFKSSIADDLQREIWPLFEKKIIKPVVYKTLNFNDFKQAHDLMESSKHIGKIVLEL